MFFRPVVFGGALAKSEYSGTLLHVVDNRNRITGATRSLAVASNRLPFTFKRTSSGLQRQPSPGGLVTALDPALRTRSGIWIGWPGIGLREGEKIREEADPYQILPVSLSPHEIKHYYHGLSNRTLWPILHSMPTRASFDRRDWNVYSKVNERFGSEIAAHAPNESLVWVHDYHLMLAPDHIRRELPSVHLAFFLHTPFPPHDVFRLLPWDRDLLRGLLDCDLLGFHIESYAQNFLDCAERTLGARVNREELLVEYGGRTAQVGAFPLGIDFEHFQLMARQAASDDLPETENIVLGVDRLDYTKGIPDRVRAFGRLLEQHPEHRGKVTLLQIAVPSRSQVGEYRMLKRELDELVGRLNGRFGRPDWSPIRHLYRSFDHDELAAIYRDADVALVTPLRDGLNLVAKEYVACQVDDPGVLVLSRLTGAAATMREALLVNPYDIDGTADTIHRALTMDDSERASRIAALRRRERRDNVHAWVESFLEAADEAHPMMVPISDTDFESWLGRFLRRHRLVLFLDYDGTLTPIVDHPSEAILGARMRRALEVTASQANNEIVIISGRAIDDVRDLVGFPELTYVGNHGFEIDGPDIDHFIHEDLAHYCGRATELMHELEGVSIDGAWTEAKGPTLTWHYRAVPEGVRGALVEEARGIIQQAGFQSREAHFALEARPPVGWDKGQAALHILRERYGAAWSEEVRVIYVGDDETDEDAFRLLAGLAQTFRVGPPETSTAATRRLSDVNAVRTLLEWLARRKT